MLSQLKNFFMNFSAIKFSVNANIANDIFILKRFLKNDKDVKNF